MMYCRRNEIKIQPYNGHGNLLNAAGVEKLFSLLERMETKNGWKSV